MNGEVVYIHLAENAEDTPVAVDLVKVEEGKGLVGDRYHAGTGTYSETLGTGRHVTLIESEAIEALERDFGVKLAPGESRRNITTRGVRLNDLVDREVRVGEAVLRGMRLAGPCQHLEEMVGQSNVIKGLAQSGGLRCEVVRGGTISVGDAITPL